MFIRQMTFFYKGYQFAQYIDSCCIICKVMYFLDSLQRDLDICRQNLTFTDMGMSSAWSFRPSLVISTMWQKYKRA